MSDTTTETTEGAGETSADTTTETKTETTSEQVDWQAKFEAQQRVTRDLEKKVKGEAGSLKAELDALRAKLEGKEAEHAAEQSKREAERAALAKADGKILKAEVRAAAAAKLADPQDALRFLDLSDFEVGADGEVDADAINDAIEDLIKNKPYLAAQGGKKFQGSADGGARNESAAVSQLTQSDMDRMTPEQKVAAYESGQFDQMLGRS